MDIFGGLLFCPPWQDQHTLFEKDSIVNIVGFVGHIFSVAKIGYVIFKVQCKIKMHGLSFMHRLLNISQWQ